MIDIWLLAEPKIALLDSSADFDLLPEAMWETAAARFDESGEEIYRSVSVKL